MLAGTMILGYGSPPVSVESVASPFQRWLAMGEISARQLGVLLVGVAMIALGRIGLTGNVTVRPVLVAALVIVVAVLSFEAGRMTAE